MSRHSSHQNNNSGCGPDCTYRGLYEGTQASLSDMARRQADALRRVGRLRGAIVILLKRHFPKAFAQAENSLGGRLSDVDDEILLAYLAGFIGDKPDGSDEKLFTTLKQVNDLKISLLNIGLNVQGNDPSLWIEVIKSGNPVSNNSELDILPSITPTTLNQAENRKKLVTDFPYLSSSTSSEKKTEQSDFILDSAITQPQTGQIDSENTPFTNNLGSLFEKDASELNEEGIRSIGAEQGIEKLFLSEESNGQLGDLFLESKTQNSNLADIFNEPFEKKIFNLVGDIANIETENQYTNSNENIINEKNETTVSDYKKAVETSKVSPEIESALDAEYSKNIDDNISVNTIQSSNQETQENDTTDQITENEEIIETSQVELNSIDVLDKDVSDTKISNGIFQGQSANKYKEKSNPTITNTNASSHGLAQPLRPQLFTPPKVQKTTRRGSKTIVSRAERPDLQILDVPLDADASVTISDDINSMLIEACNSHRPVFTSDLVTLSGSAQIVATWESNLRADPTKSPLRFLAAKGRHRHRGSLIVPVSIEKNQKNGKNGWWSDCVDTYRGSRLYELAVILHRVGGEVVSANFGEKTALLRLSSSRGLVGVVIVFDSKVNDELNRNSINERITMLLGERLTLIAVLTAAGESIALSNLISTVASLAESGNWSSSFPIIAARSWEFADDRGSTANHIFGG